VYTANLIESSELLLLLWLLLKLLLLLLLRLRRCKGGKQVVVGLLRCRLRWLRRTPKRRKKMLTNKFNPK
jgi:hypothetical protein